ncbi:hypothetical protein ACSBR2_022179 [Camellia fascicularis]
MALRFVLERTVKIKTGYVNPKLGFWFASSAFKPQLYSSLPRTDHYPLFEDIIVPRLASRRHLVGGTALYRPLDHPEILRIARIAVKQYNRQQVLLLLLCLCIPVFYLYNNNIKALFGLI